MSITVKYYSGVFEHFLLTTCKMLIFVPLKIVVTMWKNRRSRYSAYAEYALLEGA